MASSLEEYLIRPTKYVPNSDLPVLVYRNCLPYPRNRETATEFIEKNLWQCRGEWGEIKRPHYHSTTHEAYGIISGRSNLVLGRGHLDDPEDGVELSVETGDVIVNPAGVSHYSKDSEHNYRYIGIYPRKAPKWDSNGCKDPVEASAKRENVKKADFPEADPVFGPDGPMMTIWGAIKAA